MSQRLDLYCKQRAKQLETAQKFLDALKILDRAKYDEVLKYGTCTLNGFRIMVNKKGKVKKWEN